MTPQTKLYGLMAEFESPDHLLEAAEKTRDAGYKKIDAYAPYPIHGLSEALGLAETKVPLIVLCGGICGVLGGFFMMYYSAVITYPINIGGRPYNSWPAFIPITFECMILLSAFAAVLGMLGLNGLPAPYHPVFNVESFARASQDKYFLVIESRDPHFDVDKTREFLKSLGPEEIAEVAP